ncbi:helix-turn-helix domain-containing protein [Pararhizobium sp.]|uniref:helix-turn-helix domain-containing protein n=1 Tax=Pararhizobium sp. TaxID=1977563 RepID=UPI0027234FF6|nr:helix-turn-helix domain-containing protein [Pararhizobium sp.]MDO9417314.1 helix-turn-helix domain-containing protein [Pararhizobium sp.]
MPAAKPVLSISPGSSGLRPRYRTTGFSLAAPERKGRMSGHLAPVEIYDPERAMALRVICQAVRQLVTDILVLASERVQVRRDYRRTGCHVRQITMYVCHVALRLSMSDVGQAFGRDRTTVAHACGVVEDRRDDASFNDFIAVIERMVTAVFTLDGGRYHV